MPIDADLKQDTVLEKDASVNGTGGAGSPNRDTKSPGRTRCLNNTTKRLTMGDISPKVSDIGGPSIKTESGYFYSDLECDFSIQGRYQRGANKNSSKYGSSIVNNDGLEGSPISYDKDRRCNHLTGTGRTNFNFDVKCSNQPSSGS